VHALVARGIGPLESELALRRLGNLKAGERVLIHSASGGVGLATIQLARQIGAEVFVTVGSSAKREYLESLGIQHVMNSRAIDFADEIMKATAGEGIDLVVNSLTGEGLADALKGASVAVDVTNSPSWEDAAVLKFFETSTRNLLKYEAAAGVRHHLALSVVGTERLLESGFFRAKLRQEDLIKASATPHSIVRATQFFEFVTKIADLSTEGNKVRLPPVRFQPIAAEDVASALCRVALGSPLNGSLEIGGPEQFRLDELIRRELAARKDAREVVSDPRGRYYGIAVSERTMVPNDDAQLGKTRFEDWLRAAKPVPKTRPQGA
jgi:uncharacterized protein YbjT (DUF2867 family)